MPATCATTSRRRADRNDRATARAAGRRGEQRRWIAVCARLRRIGKIQQQDHRAQPDWAAVGFTTRECCDAVAGAGRFDREHRQCQRPSAHSRHRGIRGGQGRRRKPHQHTGCRVGAEGQGQLRRSRHGRDRAVPTVLRRRGIYRSHLCQCATRPARQARRCRLGRCIFGIARPLPTSAVRPSRCTVAASRRTTWRQRTQSSKET